jgi:hypothetical protein
LARSQRLGAALIAYKLRVWIDLVSSDKEINEAAMRTPKFVVTVLLFTVLCAASSEVLAQGNRKGSANRPVAGCPLNARWELISLESIGLSGAVGLPSIDGNGDGWSCAFFQDLGHGQTGVVLRDNNVQ